MRKVVDCLWCKTSFEAYVSRNRKFCTHQCSANYNKKSKRSRTGNDIPCNTCGTLIYRSQWQLISTNKHYCSSKCKNKGLLVPRFEITCSLDSCNNVFYRTNRDIKNSENNNFFCSSKCSALHGLQIIQKTKHKVKGTKPEKEFENLLIFHNINYIFQYSLQWMLGWKKWYDFYLPEYNTLVEVDGTYWHGKDLTDIQLNEQQKQTRSNDQLKNDLAIKQGFHLVRIWSDEIQTFDIDKIKSIKL